MSAVPLVEISHLPKLEHTTATVSAQKIEKVSLSGWFRRSHILCQPAIGTPSESRCVESLSERLCEVPSSVLTDSLTSFPNTVFYLAYGSNLSAETFLGKRNIHPISQLNVVVPSLKLTFDLPGIPYIEPCFANTALADGDKTWSNSNTSTSSPCHIDEKTPLITSPTSRYHKERWHKGLVGVVYELTKEDFIHVIATEGGGAGYHDITVICYPLEPDTETVPISPSTAPLKAHTLFAPFDPPGEGSRPRRHMHGYAQASARYLTLIMHGAIEHKLPREYREYLAQIRPYKITTAKQQIGRLISLLVWGPLLMLFFTIAKMFQNKEGISPPWVVRMMEVLFVSIWGSYDNLFKKFLGDGERTEGEGPELRKVER